MNKSKEELGFVEELGKLFKEGIIESETSLIELKAKLKIKHPDIDLEAIEKELKY